MTTTSTHSQPRNTRVIAVTPDLIALAGDGNAAILLAQILFWWKVAGRRKFYKFNSPCDHALYRRGDSWAEEVCLKRTMFATARRRVAVKVRISSPDEIQSAFAKGALVVYGTDENHLTWYLVNEPALQLQSPSLYARLVGADSPSNAPAPLPTRPTQSPSQPAEPTPQRVNHTSNHVLQNSTPQSPTAPMGNVGVQHSPMQGSSIGFNTESFAETAPQTAPEKNSLQTPPTKNTPLPTPIAALSGGGEVKSSLREIAATIYNNLQKRGVQSDPARLIARRAVQSGWGVVRTLEVFDAHGLDAERAGARSAVGVAVSRMLDGVQITPAPEWAVSRVRRLNQEQAWAERCEAVGVVGESGDSDLTPKGGEPLVEQSPLKTLWERVLGDIKLQVTRATFEQRFRNTWLEQRDNTYIVCARDPHTVEWLSHRLDRMITTTLQRWGGNLGQTQVTYGCG